jgi:hypothetical protein
MGDYGMTLEARGPSGSEIIKVAGTFHAINEIMERASDQESPTRELWAKGEIFLYDGAGETVRHMDPKE